MKINEKYIVHNTNQEGLLIPTGGAEFSGIVRGNKTLGAVLELLQTETTEKDVIERLCERFEAPEMVIAADVRKVLKELRDIGAIDE